MLAAASTLVSIGVSAQAAVAAPDASGDSYSISVTTGASMLTGSTDAGIHCYYSCGTYLYSPFPITAYGQQYSQMYVTTNGSIQFGDANDTANYNRCLPTSTFNGPTFLPYWNYGSTYDSGYGVFYRTYGSAPYRQFVVEWRVYDGNSGNYENFSQAFAEGSGVVTTTYGTTGGSYATVGAQNAGGSTATQYACNTSDGATYPGLQIKYTPTNTTPTGGPPAAPTQVGAQPVGTEPKANITWQEPTSDGGSPITGYTVSRDGNSSTGSGPFTSVTLAADRRNFIMGKLIPGTVYHFTVRAQNANGTGPGTTISYAVPKGGSTNTVPGAPQIGQAQPGAPGGQLGAVAKWGAPASNGGSAITGYIVYAYRVVNCRNVETMVSPRIVASARSYNFVLDHSGKWRFRVVAKNQLGNSAFSGYSNIVAGR